MKLNFINLTLFSGLHFKKIIYTVGIKIKLSKIRIVLKRKKNELIIEEF